MAGANIVYSAVTSEKLSLDTSISYTPEYNVKCLAIYVLCNRTRGFYRDQGWIQSIAPGYREPLLCFLQGEDDNMRPAVRHSCWPLKWCTGWVLPPVGGRNTTPGVASSIEVVAALQPFQLSICALDCTVFCLALIFQNRNITDLVFCWLKSILCGIKLHAA